MELVIYLLSLYSTIKGRTQSQIWYLHIDYQIQILGKLYQDAAIIIGEMEFHSKGYAIAEGADWDRLLNNQRQTQLPHTPEELGELQLGKSVKSQSHGKTVTS